MTILRISLFIIVISISILIIPRFYVNKKSIHTIQPSSQNASINELKDSVKLNGLNYERLNKLNFYLSNFEIDLSSEEKYIGSLPKTFEREFLKSILLKREQKFEEMFSLLNSFVNFNPKFYEYYEELVFAAQASNKISLLKEHYSKEGPTKFNIYSSSLIYTSLGRFSDAKNKIEELIKLNNNDYKPYYQLSIILKNLGDYDGSFRALSKSDELAKSDIYYKAKAYLLKGSLLYFSGKYNEAKIFYNKAIETSNISHDLISESKALANKGIIFDENGNIDSSRNYFNKSLQIARSIKAIDEEAFVYSELGVSFTYTNQLIEAKDHYIKSINLYSKLGNRIRLAFLYNNLGKVYQSYFNYSAAIENFNKGLEFAGENKRAQIQSLIGIADIYSNLSNYSKALEYYNRAKILSTEIKEISSEAEVEIGLGSLNYNLNLYTNALSYFKQAEKLFLKINNPNQIPGIYDKIGLVFVGLDSVSKAENYFSKAISESNKIGDEYAKLNSMINLAYIQIKNSRLREAKILLSKINPIPNTYFYNEFICQKYLILGEISQLENHFASAENFYLKVLQIAQKNNLKEILIEDNYRLAKLLESFDSKKAEKYYESSINKIEDISRPLFENDEVQIAYFSGKNEIYKSFTEFCINHRKFDKAFELIDRFRSRNTMQNLNNLVIQSLINDKSELEKLFEYDWMINSGLYEKEKDSLKKEFENFKVSLIQKEPRLNKYLFNNKNQTLPDIHAQLDDKEYIITYFISDNMSFLFVTGKNMFQPIRLNTTKNEIAELVSKISPFFKNKRDNSYFINQDLFSFNAQNSYTLQEKIIKPILKFVPMHSKLIIIPSSELMVLPFEFLITSYNMIESPYDYQNKHFLLFDYNISYASSPSNYLELKNSKLLNDGDIFLLGDPSVNNNNNYTTRRGLLSESVGLPRNINLLPLKYSKDEILQIHNITDASNIFLAKDATESNFKKYSGYNKVIHLSTHSFLYNRQPLIFFSNTNDKENDGFLEAGEIVQLKLNSELVVLSSCNSGLGLIDEAEGVIGMTKAFYEAGAKSVVVSLWDVNDNFTSKLMSLYYAKMSSGYDKSEALRQAKIEFIKKYSPNPYFWSAFIISGDTSKLKLDTRNTYPFYIIGILSISLLLFAIFIILRKKRISKL
jgi:CHAT domain-containing protein/tetratricopeptide (TPR) repeat protein